MIKSREGLTVRTKLLLAVGISFLLASAAVVVVADKIMTTKANEQETQLFADRLSSICDLLQRKQELLSKTGMQEAYRDGFQKAAQDELTAHFYTGGHATTYPFILDARGRVVLHPRLKPEDESLIGHDVVKKMLSSATGAGEYTDSGIAKWCMYRTFSPWKWKVVYTSSLQDKYAAVYEFRRTFLAIMGLTALAVLGVLAAMVSFATKPIRELTLATSRMAAGDLDQKVDVTRQDEIGTLARSFAEMGLAIRAKIGKLDQEIADRQKTQETLREKTAFLEAQVEACLDGILIVDDRGQRVLTSRRCLEILKVPPEIANNPDDSVLLRHVTSLTKDPKQFIAKVHDLFAHRDQTSRDELELQDGTILDRYSSPVTGYDGHYYGRIWTFRDVTEQRRAQEELARLNRTLEHEVLVRTAALNESREYLQTIFDSVGAGIVVIDPQTHLILDLNRAAEILVGRPKSEVVGHVCHRFICPAELGKCPITELGQTVDRSERALLDATGRRVPITKSVVPVTVNGRPCLLETFVDISDQKAAQLEAEQANEKLRDAIAQSQRLTEESKAANAAKSEFLANMSHEIRTPMNGVIGMLELMANTALTAQQSRYAKTIRRSADTLLNLVNDILDFSKIEAGKLTLEPMAFDLQAAMEEVSQIVAPNIHNPNVEVIVRYQDQTPRWVMGDPARIRQIVTNLIGNGVKFTQQGHVLLTVRSVPAGPGKAVFHLEVQDTGIGIAPDKLETIFEKFSQADASTTRKFGGTGLGLAISKKLLELMGGKIWVQSQEGKGSTFHMELTMELAQPTSGADQRDPVNLSGMNVLIVDDNQVNREVLDGMVRGWKMEPTLAAGGAEALELLEAAARARGRFDLMLIDVNMPHMDGFAFVDRVQKSPYPVCGPILMLSSSGHGKESALCRARNLACYLVKPVRRAELLEAIQVAMGGNSKTLPKRMAPESAKAGRALHILLAEDNLVNQDVAVGLLENLGHTVEVVANGREAVSAARNGQYDLIFMDVQMPEMGGYEATAAIRAWQRESGRRLPIIAMTAHALKGDAEKCIRAGMDEYVSKPISGVSLASAIAKVLVMVPPSTSQERVSPASESLTVDTVGNVVNEPAVWDYEGLLHRCMGNATLVHRVTNRFLDTADQVFQQVRQTLAQDDARQAAHHAHALKGMAANISAESLRAVAAEVEQLAATGAAAAAQSCVPRLQVELDRCLAQVRTLQVAGKQGS